MNYPPLWSQEVEDRLRSEASNIDPQKTPVDVRFCKKCVVSNARPRITFDDEGVCSACRYAESKSDGSIDWGERHEELIRLLEAHRGRGHYDVVVPASGGKDSASVAHKLKHEHGMNPLVVKWAPFAYTDIGFKNFNAFVHSGFDVQVGWPNGLTHRKLTRLALEYVGDPFLPFIYGQMHYAQHIAQHHGIGLVFLGENGEAEYGGDTAANDKPCWGKEDWGRIYMKGADAAELFSIGIKNGCFTKEEALQSTPFYRPPPSTASRRGTPEAEVHWFSYYEKWHPQGNYYYACNNTGFEANPEGRSTGTYSKYASIDDLTDDFHYYLGFLKFGIGRCTSDAAHEVRDGEITRDEAVALVEKYDGEFPRKNMQHFLDYVGIDNEKWLHQVFVRFMPKEIWERDADFCWTPRNRVYDAETKTDSAA